ncbi:HEAT repeat domain-containing protein [Synechococcus sp. MIT S9503]|uniref:HEAT repeat domain-containing protein n=1 Tax=Synechococcus sp. MIT S9503 TaxID=3082547 RepID=UPI0039A741FF|tara:strand:+ start:940 stop:1821 length:882 start_codon:yes stop_codon:yes gene_type:complete
MNDFTETQLSQEEALDLANHLKEKLRAGLPIDADPDSIATMVAALGDPRGLLRRQISEGLGSIGEAAVPALCQAMRRSDQVTVRRAAAKTLALIADRNSLPDLLATFLTDTDSVVQGSSMGAMASMGEDSIGAILSIVENPESTEMQIGLANWALTLIGDRAPEVLRGAISSENSKVRKAAISALGSQIQSLNSQQDRDLLQQALHDTCAEIRSEAVILLGNLEDSEWALPLLSPALSDQDSWVRKNTALSLMKLGCSSSIPNLQTQLESESDSVVRKVLQLAVDRLQQSDKN